jgi:2',3'-cyclic-nucleotide 2'-phosphodiesterase (5'-nucleotidase family)
VAHPELSALVKPYKDSVNKLMNDTIAFSAVKLVKAGPNGTLGHFLTDVILSKTREVTKKHVDAAILNPGGIRLNMLTAGPVTRSKLFELLPFDNQVVLLSMTSKMLQEFLDYTASKGGWPMTGISYKLQTSKATEIKIGDADLNSDKTYIIALPDYVANGGDDAIMLKAIPQSATGLLMRDVVIYYLAELHRSGKQLHFQNETRITDAN